MSVSSIPPAKLGHDCCADAARPIARAIDDTGQDVTDLVREARWKSRQPVSGADNFRASPATTILKSTSGDDAPKTGPLYLIAQGSIHDTESSVNVAITQGKPLARSWPERRSARRPRRLGYCAR